MRIDRYEHAYRPLRDNFLVGFTRFTPCFRLIYPLLLLNLYLAFAKRSPCFRQTLALFSLNARLAFAKHSPCFRQTLASFSPHYLFVLVKLRRGFCVLLGGAIRRVGANYVLSYLVDIIKFRIFANVMTVSCGWLMRLQF